MAKGRRENDGFERRLRAALEHMTRDEAAAAVARAQAEVEALIANGLEQEREICRLEAALEAAEAKLQRERSTRCESGTTTDGRSEDDGFRVLRWVGAPPLWEEQLDYGLRRMYPNEDQAALGMRKASVRKSLVESQARAEAEAAERRARTGQGP